MTESVFHLLLDRLVARRGSIRLSELVMISENVAAASRLLHPDTLWCNATSLEVARLGHEVTSWRRRLEARLARAGFQSTDPRLISEAATEMVQLVRLITRVVRCREWLRAGDPVEAVELQSAAGRGAQLVADSALQLASTGTLTSDSGDVIRSRAEELYSRGLVRAFAECADPLEVLRHRTLYDGLLGVVIGSDSALASLRDASAD